jgi:RNA polymerase subunit RPABC4/transcription elongation factor Spt4
MSENEAQSCPKCGTLTKEGDVFCRVCGSRYVSGINEIKLPPETRRICWNCGNTLRPAARFCDLCGEECVRLRRERRGWKRKTNGCFLIFAAALLWLAAGVSAIAIYNASKDASFRGILTYIRESFFASDSGDSVSESEGAKEELGGGDGAAVSEDLYETVISNDSLPAVTPIADDETDISPPASRPGGQEEEEGQTGQNSPENTDGGSPSGVRDEGTKAEENTSSDAESGAVVLASPLSVSPESEDQTVSEDVAVSSDERQSTGPGAWTEQDAEGYSIVAANDRFFTSSQTPSLRGTVTADHVRVRSAPNTASRIRRQLDSGAEVELVRRFSSGKEPYYWFEVRSSGGSGWIYGEFIKPEADGNRVPPASPSADMGNRNGESAAETVINTSP